MPDWISPANLQTLVAFLIFFVTTAYAWTTHKQLKAMHEALKETRRSNDATEKSNEIAERSLMLGRRAWLIPRIDPRSPTGPEETFGGRRLIVWVSNSGGIPGKITSAGGDMKAGHPLGDDVMISCNPTSEIVIPSNAGVGDPFLTFPVDDFTGEAERFEIGAAVLYAACRINYTDAFQSQFTTEIKWFRGRDGKWYTWPTGNIFT